MIETSPNGSIVADELPDDVKLEVLKEKRKAYFRARFDADVDYRIGQRLEDESLKQRQLNQIRRIEQAIELINEEINKVDSRQ